MSDMPDMSMVDMLMSMDGVESVGVEVTMRPTIKKRNTGEVDDVFNEIRERAVSEEQMAELLEDTEWQYNGEVDVNGDYRVTDRLTLRTRCQK